MVEFFDNALVILYKHVSLSIDFLKLFSTPPHLSHTQLLSHPACWSSNIFGQGLQFLSQQKQYRFVLLFTANPRVNSSSDLLVTEGW